jgi:hypothetical protein
MLWIHLFNYYPFEPNCSKDPGIRGRRITMKYLSAQVGKMEGKKGAD